MALILTTEQHEKLIEMTVQLAERAYAAGFDHGAFIAATQDTDHLTPSDCREILAKRMEKIAEIVSELALGLGE